MEIKVNDTLVKLIEGDIAREDTEAIVNAANNRLWMGSGVAGAIKKLGGMEIEEEAVAKGPIRVGEAVITGGGKLKARYVIHAASMGDSPVDIEGATESVLGLLTEHGIQSVSFPALATGVAGFPADSCAEIMLGSILKYLDGDNRLKEVRFVLWGRDNLEIFEKTFERLLRKKSKIMPNSK